LIGLGILGESAAPILRIEDFKMENIDTYRTLYLLYDILENCSHESRPLLTVEYHIVTQQFMSKVHISVH
jgi:hypothetical protein